MKKGLKKRHARSMMEQMKRRRKQVKVCAIKRRGNLTMGGRTKTKKVLINLTNRVNL